MISLLKYPLLVVSTAVAFAGAWFVKFTREDPKDPQRLVLFNTIFVSYSLVKENFAVLDQLS
jgi:hypothetical protein